MTRTTSRSMRIRPGSRAASMWSMWDLRGQAADLGRELDAARHRQAWLKKQLRNFDEGAAHETLEVLKTAEYERGRAEAQLAEKEKAISSLRYRIGQLEKERDRAT